MRTVYAVGAWLAAGLLAIVQRWGPGTPLWVPLAAAWTGAGAIWAWGTWAMLLSLMEGLSGMGVPDRGLLASVEFAQVIAGVMVESASADG